MCVDIKGNQINKGDFVKITNNSDPQWASKGAVGQVVIDTCRYDVLIKFLKGKFVRNKAGHVLYSEQPNEWWMLGEDVQIITAEEAKRAKIRKGAE